LISSALFVSLPAGNLALANAQGEQHEHAGRSDFESDFIPQRTTVAKQFFRSSRTTSTAVAGA
jgi:hypothetical protein